MKQELLGKLKDVFGLDEYVYAESEKYEYSIALGYNKVHIRNAKWKDSICVKLLFVPCECFLNEFTFSILDSENFSDVVIPEKIKKDIVKDFDSFFTAEKIDEICNKEIARQVEEKRQYELEIEKATNDFFGINEGDKN